jgi:polyhydroxybutyrate depolymerase
MRFCIALFGLLLVPLTGLGQEEATMQRRTLLHQEVEREYFVHLPPTYEAGMPLVVALHGYGSTATGFAAAHDLNAHADQHGYAVVYPQGTHFSAEQSSGERSLVTSWNDLAANLGPKAAGPHCVDGAVDYPCPPECGECNRCAWTACYDDLGFIERMLDTVADEFETDARRVYLLGVSNGGMMALRLGCDLSYRFAAVAPIIAQLAPGYDCGPDTDLPMLHLYGGRDDTVRYDGAPGADGFIYTTAAKTAATWAGTLACATGPAPWRNDYSEAAGLVCTAYSDCRVAGQEVVSCLDPDGDHDWPGQRVASISPTCTDPLQQASLPGQAPCPTSASPPVTAGMDLVWDFFRRYSREPVN